MWAFVSTVSQQIEHESIMSCTPQMDPDKDTESFFHSLKAYRDAGGLVKMSRKQLEHMPKEVMICLAPNEIALVWDKLPNHLQHDRDMLKYQFCYDHNISDSESSNIDVNDGPLTRKLFCCYCKVSDVTINTENSTSTDVRKEKSIGLLNPLSCCSTSCSKSQ